MVSASRTGGLLRKRLLRRLLPHVTRQRYTRLRADILRWYREAVTPPALLFRYCIVRIVNPLRFSRLERPNDALAACQQQHTCVQHLTHGNASSWRTSSARPRTVDYRRAPHTL